MQFTAQFVMKFYIYCGQNLHIFSPKCPFPSIELRTFFPFGRYTSISLYLYLFWYPRVTRLTCRIPRQQAWNKFLTLISWLIYPHLQLTDNPERLHVRANRCHLQKEDQASVHPEITGSVWDRLVGSSRENNFEHEPMITAASCICEFWVYLHNDQRSWRSGYHASALGPLSALLH